MRLNDDNIPYKNYLEILRNNFNPNIDIVYARVKFRGHARKKYINFLKEKYYYPEKSRLQKIRHHCGNFQ